jgi:peroxin-3
MEELVLRESGILSDGSATLIPSHAHPSAQSSPTTQTSLRRLLDETADLIESPAFTHVLTLLLDAAFSLLLDKKLASGAFELPPPPPGADAGVATRPELAGLQVNKAVLLPRILSVLTRQAHVIGNGMPNEFLEEMERVRDLEGFAAVVYSSNWESEIAGGEGMAGRAVLVEQAKGTAEGPLRQSQASGTSVGDASLVVIDPSQSSFESAWERAVEQK